MWQVFHRDVAVSSSIAGILQSYICHVLCSNKSLFGQPGQSLGRNRGAWLNIAGKLRRHAVMLQSS